MGIDMVGRDRELTVLDAALAARRPTLVAVVGEPGIGKTRLLAEVAARAESREMLVLDGRAAEFERDLPFAVWVDALDDHLRSREHEPIDELGGQDVVDELASVLPALANRSSGRASAPYWTSATACTRPRARCSPHLPPTDPSCCCSTTCTGPTRDRST